MNRGRHPARQIVSQLQEKPIQDQRVDNHPIITTIIRPVYNHLSAMIKMRPKPAWEAKEILPPEGSPRRTLPPRESHQLVPGTSLEAPPSDKLVLSRPQGPSIVKINWRHMPNCFDGINNYHREDREANVQNIAGFTPAEPDQEERNQGQNWNGADEVKRWFGQGAKK